MTQEDDLHSELSSTARMWQEFVRYMIRHSPDEPCIGTISILAEGNAPAAWHLSISHARDIGAPDPGNIERQWQAFVRHLLARCKGNTGFGILRATVVIAGKRPYFWAEASMTRIHPVEVVDEAGRGVVCDVLFPAYLRASNPV